MKVISGIFKGRKILFLKKGDIRPTKNIVKRSIFDSLNEWIIGKEVLDIFAGTGALGIEAISRGAKKVVFVESMREAVKVIRKNVENLQLKNVEIIKGDVGKVLKYLEDRKFDLVIADPPYEYSEKMLGKLLEKIGSEILKEEGIIVVEYSAKKKLPEIKGLKVYRSKKYGNTSITFLRKENEKQNCSLSRKF